MNAFRLISTKNSSEKYGACECCGTKASEVFHLITYKVFFSKLKMKESLTYSGDKFGHKACLSSMT